MHDYIPDSDAAFQQWLANFVAQLEAQAGALPALAADLPALQAVRDAVDARMVAHREARAAAQAAQAAKDLAVRQAVRRARAAARRLQADPAATDSLRRSFGLTVPDRTRTPVAAPQSPPHVMFQAAERFRHTLRLLDGTGGLVRRGKPRGALGCEVWLRIEPPAGTGATGPAAAGEFSLLGITTNGRFEQVFKDPVGGWTAHYRARWFSRRGEKGPWSETISATIPG